MDIPSKSVVAAELFASGANCAQAVAGAFAAECGRTAEDMFRIASGFGAGMGRMREVCGAFSGAVIVLDMLYGSGDISDKKAKDDQYARIQELAGSFVAENGSVVCRVLLGLERGHVDGPVSEERTPEYYRKRPCKEIVAGAAALLEKFIQEHPIE